MERVLSMMRLGVLSVEFLGEDVRGLLVGVRVDAEDQDASTLRTCNDYT